MSFFNNYSCDQLDVLLPHSGLGALLTEERLLRYCCQGLPQSDKDDLRTVLQRRLDAAG